MVRKKKKRFGDRFVLRKYSFNRSTKLVVLLRFGGTSHCKRWKIFSKMPKFRSHDPKWRPQNKEKTEVGFCQKKNRHARVEGLSLTEHGGQSEDYEGKEGRGLHGLLCWGCVAARTEKKKKQRRFELFCPYMKVLLYGSGAIVIVLSLFGCDLVVRCMLVQDKRGH
jgi:hypothetical protein